MESAHGVEQAAERAVRLAQHAHRSHKEKPYRRADRAEAKADRANLRALDKTAQHHDPQFSSNPLLTLAAEAGHQAGVRRPQSRKKRQEYGQSLRSHGKGGAESRREHKENRRVHRPSQKGFLIVGGIAAMIVLSSAPFPPAPC